MNKFLFFLLLFFLTFSITPQSGDKEECIVENTCIILVPIENGYELYLKNKIQNSEISKSIVFNLSVKNLITDYEFPRYIVLKGNDPVFITKLKIDDPTKSNFYSYSVIVNYGDWNAYHDDSFSYSLPFPEGVRARVGQGYNGNFTHTGYLRYSIDFSVPIGTPILAARRGTVVSLVKKYSEGGLRKDLLSKANYIMIQHEDGTIGNYAHLKKDGVVVNEGDFVEEGQLIGYSGNTGFSQGPHLHFEVHKPTKELKIQTIPTHFKTQYNEREILSHMYLYWKPRKGIDPPTTDLLDEDILLCKTNKKDILSNCNDTIFRLGEAYAIQFEFIKPTEKQIELFLSVDGNAVEPYYLKWNTQKDSVIDNRYFEIRNHKHFLGDWRMVVKVDGIEKKRFFFQIKP